MREVAVQEHLGCRRRSKKTIPTARPNHPDGLPPPPPPLAGGVVVLEDDELEDELLDEDELELLEEDELELELVPDEELLATTVRTAVLLVRLAPLLVATNE